MRIIKELMEIWPNEVCDTLASACALCLDLLSRVWLHISGGLNCCQEYRIEVVYRLIGVRIGVKDIKDFNL